jgi:hypothetical protein
MHQLDIEDEIARRLVLDLVAGKPDHFRREFSDWLRENWSVWTAFQREADRIWNRGRRHYSARTIGEVLRHESALREGPNEHNWKLNDHYWPDLARLYMLTHQGREGFFERRVSPATLRAA